MKFFFRERTPLRSRAPVLVMFVAASCVVALLGLSSPVESIPGKAEPAPAYSAQLPERGDGIAPSADALEIVDRIVATDDAMGLAFVVIDKVAATLSVYAANGQLLAVTPVLLGAARGDFTAPGVGDRPISAVRPEERTTPAGRFIGEMGRNARNEDVVWVDYDAGVSIHRVLNTNLAEQRLERLQSPSVDDNRISYGCVNVPVDFYEREIRPLFIATRLLIYVLPEATRLDEVFAFRSKDELREALGAEVEPARSRHSKTTI